MEIPDRLKGTWWDQPLPMEELEAITPISTDRARAFELTPFEMLGLGLLFIGNDNTIVLPLTNSAGPKRPVLEDNSASNLATLQLIEVLQTSIDGELSKIKNAIMLNTQTRQVSGGDETQLFRAQKQLEAIDITLVGGALANVSLLPALAGFVGYVQPICIWSDTADHYTFAFEDENDADCRPTNATPVGAEIKAANEIGPFASTHTVPGDSSGSPPILPQWRGIAANLAIEVDVLGGAGGELIVLWYNRWYEDA